ncbi:hypothetical protein H0H93_000988 [Arthromyces matolae]|nr:hypothetical protein H0H93_000988 [Arthromyces matolae]
MNYDAMASGSSDPLFLERLDTFMEGTLADIKAFADREFRPLEETLRFVAEWHARNLFRPTRQDDSTQDRTSRGLSLNVDVRE